MIVWIMEEIGCKGIQILTISYKLCLPCSKYLSQKDGLISYNGVSMLEVIGISKNKLDKETSINGGHYILVSL